MGANFLIFIDEFFPIGRDKEQVLRAIAERVGDNMEANDRIAIVAWNGEEIETIIDWTSSVDEASAAMEVALERESFGLRREQERRRFLQDRDDFATMSAARSSRAGADPFGDPMGGRSNDRYGRATSSWDRQWRLGTQERAYAQMLAGQIQGAVGAASASMRALEAPPGRNVLVLLSGGWPWNPSQYASGTGSRMLNEPLVSEGLEIYGPIAETANLMGYTIYGIDVPGMQMGRGFDPTVGGTSLGMGSLGGSSDQFLLEMEIHDSLQFMAQETGGLALINAQRIDALDEIGEVERKGRREITVPVTVSIPLSRMSLQPGEDGTLVAQLALIMVALDDEGGRIDIPAQQLVLTVTGEPRADTMARYETTIELRRRDYNLAMIVGDDGVIIVDPPEDVNKGLVTLAEFRKFSDKPVKAVIYSHWHIDHYAGVAAFASHEDVASGAVKIIAHKDFLGNMIKNSTGGTGPIIAARVDYSLGDPTFLAPTRPLQASERYVRMMGGRDAVFAAAVEAAEGGDQQWAAELTTHLIRIDHDDRDARDLKAEALRRIGYTQTNTNWRNWYLTSAKELDGTIDFSKRLDIQAPDMLRAFPTSELIKGFRYRLKAEDVLDVYMTMGFRFPDVDEEFGLEIRRGIVQFYESMPDGADVVLEMDRATLMGLLLGELDIAGKTGVHPKSPRDVLVAVFESGDARLTRGSPQDFARFFSYFESVSTEPIPITIR